MKPIDSERHEIEAELAEQNRRIYNGEPSRPIRFAVNQKQTSAHIQRR